MTEKKKKLLQQIKEQQANKCNYQGKIGLDENGKSIMHTECLTTDKPCSTCIDIINQRKSETEGNDNGEQFILKVKNDLIEGLFYMDEIEEAYRLLTNTEELANIRVMRLAIINYEQQ